VVRFDECVPVSVPGSKTGTHAAAGRDMGLVANHLAAPDSALGRLPPRRAIDAVSQSRRALTEQTGNEQCATIFQDEERILTEGGSVVAPRVDRARFGIRHAHQG
jgi:hypothetical protein